MRRSNPAFPIHSLLALTLALALAAPGLVSADSGGFSDLETCLRQAPFRAGWEEIVRENFGSIIIPEAKEKRSVVVITGVQAFRVHADAILGVAGAETQEFNFRDPSISEKPIRHFVCLHSSELNPQPVRCQIKRRSDFESPTRMNPEKRTSEVEAISLASAWEVAADVLLENLEPKTDAVVERNTEARWRNAVLKARPHIAYTQLAQDTGEPSDRYYQERQPVKHPVLADRLIPYQSPNRRSRCESTYYPYNRQCEEEHREAATAYVFADHRQNLKAQIEILKNKCRTRDLPQLNALLDQVIANVELERNLWTIAMQNRNLLEDPAYTGRSR